MTPRLGRSLLLLAVVLCAVGCASAVTPAPAVLQQSVTPRARGAPLLPTTPQVTQASAAEAAATQMVEKAVELAVTREVAQAAAPRSVAVITTPTPKGQPGTLPAEDAYWQRVRARGWLTAAASSGFAPYADVDAGFRWVGLDVAMAGELGRRLGLPVKIMDFAAGGLLDAVRLGQVDFALVGITAIESIEGVAFTVPYLRSRDVLLVRANGPIGDLTAVANLVSRKVGMQRGSRFEALVRGALAADGRMPAANLFSYSEIAKGVADLREGNIDLMVMDRSQAEPLLAAGDLRVAGGSFFDAPLAFALPAGSARLIAELDAALKAMQAEGVTQRLASQALGLDVSALLPAADLPPAPASGGVPSAACVDGMALVDDLTYPDDNMAAPAVLLAGQPFVKTWRIRNVGTCVWDTAYSLSYGRGSSPLAQMSGLSTSVVWPVQPGTEYDLSLALVAPAGPGIYVGTWELRNAAGRPFGQRVHVGVQVPAVAISTPGPTSAPPSTPIWIPISPAPFSGYGVDRITVERGECARVTWNIQNIREIYFYAAGQPWAQHAATGEEMREVCPERSTGYELRIVNFDGSDETRHLDVTVSTQPAPPISISLLVTPNQAPTGGCFMLKWRVAGLATAVSVLRDQVMLWERAGQGGWLRDCPAEAGDVIYRVIATGMGQSYQTQRTVRLGP